VRAALGAEEQNAVANVTYETLVDAYRVHPREDVIACMEDTQAGFSRFDMLKERYGTNVMTCAVFYWVCQLMEESSLQEQSFCQAYSLPTKTFKAVVAALDKQCEGVADQIKTYLLQKRSADQASDSSQASHVPLPNPNPASPQKSPVKSAIRPRKGMSTPMTTPSKKRTVAFLHQSSGGHDGGDYDKNNNKNNVPFPETPTKKRRIGDGPSSADRMRTRSSSPNKCTTASTTAFHTALKGSSPAKPPVAQQPPVAGPSTPRRPRYATASDVTATPVHATSRPSTLPSSSPSRSQGQTTPARPPPTRRRFRPVFLEQRQWCARDPKVERMWAAAETLRDEMVELYGRPFQQMLQSAA